MQTEKWSEAKRWRVEYRRFDGVSGVMEVETELTTSGCYEYGNGKAGALIVGGYPWVYDLRYNSRPDLHMVMIEDYFGKGLVKATEI